MRIGIVTGEYPPMQGGVGAFSQIIARTLQAQGHAIFVLADARAHDEGIHVDHVRGWGPGCLPAVRRWARAQRLDIVNLQFQTAAFGMSPVVHFLPDYLRGMPLVTTFHDLRFPYLFPKAGKTRDWIVRHLARASAGVIVTNHEDYLRVRALPKAAMIPIGSNILSALPPDFERTAWRQQAGAQPDDFLIAYFGFMNRSKGVETLLHSLALLVAENVPAKLALIGGRTGTSDATNAAYADEIDALIQKLGLSSHICWTGFVDERAVSAYLAASDVVALPFTDGASFRRGTLMAAIQHGCAIVTTLPQVAIPEFVDGENMLFVPVNDSRELAAGLRRAREMPHLRVGVKALRARFDWNVIARDTAAFFGQVVNA
ncbi:MAG: glycosyltransferase family 4 protein [Chloroflexi bacterium]|nr:glycosyltransferase family 4 protein [Chloroflexota bacterium]